MNINRVYYGGNLTKDPELLYTDSGTAICKVSVASNRKWTDKQGEKKEEATFMRVTIFGKQAESTAEYMKKGSAVLIEGRLHNNRWENEAGEKRQSEEIVADRVHFIGKKGEE